MGAFVEENCCRGLAETLRMGPGRRGVGGVTAAIALLKESCLISLVGDCSSLMKDGVARRFVGDVGEGALSLAFLGMTSDCLGKGGGTAALRRICLSRFLGTASTICVIWKRVLRSAAKAAWTVLRYH